MGLKPDAEPALKEAALVEMGMDIRSGAAHWREIAICATKKQAMLKQAHI